MNDPGQGDLSQFLVLVRRYLKLADVDQDLAMNASLEELGLDSQAALSLMLDLEEEFGVIFPDSMLTEETFATPGSLREALSSLRQR